MGIIKTVWFLNLIAWGGMLFLIKVGAAKAMCSNKAPSPHKCTDLQSSGNKWMEIDIQILNALFCLPAFGYIPWRFRNLYWLLVWRLGPQQKGQAAHKQLADVSAWWYRMDTRVVEAG
jgi:hypothetical protein